MNAQTVVVPGPWSFFVTYSLEIGHPDGVAAHLSMSIARNGRVPHPQALTMVAEEMGFTGTIKDGIVYEEKLSDGGIAINVIQLIKDRNRLTSSDASP